MNRPVTSPDRGSWDRDCDSILYPGQLPFDAFPVQALAFL
jgi:hypothetical protein